MFKRLFWLTTGVAVGFGTSFWLARRVRRTVSRFTPPRVAADVSHAVRRLGSDVRAALAEGRRAMDRAESELRSDPTAT